MIRSAKDRDLSSMSGYAPKVHIRSWLQSVTFVIVKKANVNFRVQEERTEVKAKAVIIQFTEEQLKIQPVGQRSWKWYKIYSDPFLGLSTDDKVIYQGNEYRVMSVLDYSTYGYFEYNTVQGFE